MDFRATVKVKQQQGIALLMLVVVIALAAISYFLTAMSPAAVMQSQLVNSNKALHQAKQALIAYAVTYADIDANGDNLPDFPGEYGFLPCPDYNNGLAEGLEDNGNCGARSISKLGYLPWKTLGINSLKDDSGTCLMYAISGDYKNDESAFPSFKAFMLNEDSNGMFQLVDETATLVQGGVPQDRIVALVIAPGGTLPGQVRAGNTDVSQCGLDYANYSAYLDTGGGIDNSDVSNVAYQLDQFIHATASSTSDAEANPYNDRFITITRDEIWRAVVSRQDFVQKLTDLTEALAMCLGDYATASGLGRLPWPVTAALADYQQNSSYNDNSSASFGYAGRLPFIVDNSNSDIGIAGSSELFSVATCNTLNVSSGATVDLQTAGSEYRKLWDNWKDHFFYVVSKDHAPSNVAALCGADCITVDGVQQAGMVVFGGSRQAGQVRNAPVAGDADTKSDVANYLENGNQALFPDAGGNGAYNTAGTNDIMFCLSAAVSPVASPC